MGVAGKTGSCIGRGSWVGLFARSLRAEDPKYAVVVITRGEGERAETPRRPGDLTGRLAAI